jgi:hypothetical protein
MSHRLGEQNQFLSELMAYDGPPETRGSRAVGSASLLPDSRGTVSVILTTTKEAVPMSNREKKRPQKRVLILPDLEQSSL